MNLLKDNMTATLTPPMCRYCARDLEDPVEIETGLCTSDDCPRYGPPTFSERDLYKQARILRSDEGENPEYDRALVELIMYLTSDDKSVVKAKLEALK